MSKKRDYYQVLGVGRTAGGEEIKKSFRQLARQYHPDVNKEPDAAERFKEVSEAYEVLSDPEKRRAFDRFGHAGVNGGAGMGDFGFGGVSDIFEEFFSGFSMGRGQTRQSRPRRGADLHYKLGISFEQAVFGCETEIEFTRLDTCPECNGSGAEPGTNPVRCNQCNGAGEVRRVQQSIFGSFVNVATCPTCRGEGETVPVPCRNCRGNKQVRITEQRAIQVPAGVNHGNQIRLAGLGEQGTSGGPRGNLYVALEVQPHSFFRRLDNNIVLELGINIAQAALGDKIQVPTLKGEETISVPAGTQTGKILRLRGRGVPHLRGEGRGDQLIVIQVIVPTNLSDEQKELFQNLSQTLGREVIPQQEGRGILNKLKDIFSL